MKEFWEEKLTNDELLQGFNKYNNGLIQAKMGDKRRYNTKMDITFNSAMRSIYEREMERRGLINKKG